jgi:hypothetical protein
LGGADGIGILDLLDEGDITSLSDGDNALLLRSGNRIMLVEDFFKLLERAAYGLHANEVPDNGLDDVPTNEDEYIFVPDIFQGDGSAISVDEAYLGKI